MKKLVLNKETVRVLQDSELRLVAGGKIAGPLGPPRAGQVPAPWLCGSTNTDSGTTVLNFEPVITGPGCSGPVVQGAPMY